MKAGTPPAGVLDSRFNFRAISPEEVAQRGGVWGPAATRFFAEAAFYNHYNNRDIDRYHWSSEKFLSLWRTKFSVLMARERGRIGADAALGDIPKRLWAHAFDEMDDGPAR